MLTFIFEDENSIHFINRKETVAHQKVLVYKLDFLEFCCAFILTKAFDIIDLLTYLIGTAKNVKFPVDFHCSTIKSRSFYFSESFTFEVIQIICLTPILQLLLSILSTNYITILFARFRMNCMSISSISKIFASLNLACSSVN